MSVGVAFKAFFAALFNRPMAERLRLVLQADPNQPLFPASQPDVPDTRQAPPQASQSPIEPLPKKPQRSEALTLLSTLQRESRLLDLVHESLDGFEDAQIGAAAREVLRDCRKSLERMFAIAPLTETDEGATCPIPHQPSPGKYRLVGKSTGTAGQITHRGWQATRCELPQWSGQKDEAWVLAPMEIEVD
jgi:hypothetical protein